MASEPEMAELARLFDQFRSWFTQMQTEVPPGQASTVFRQLTEQFGAAQAKVMQEYPKELQRMAEMKKQAEENLASAKATFAAMEAAPPEADAPSEAKGPTVDPHLSRKLRSQLLEEFGNQPAHGTEGAPPAPKARRQPRKPPGAEQGWDSSQEWDQKGPQR